MVVVGAGAAGLMAAIHAAGGAGDPSLAECAPVLVVERSADGGRKILISGGGRCNILPGEIDESGFVTDSSPNTMKKMLRSWPLAEQRRFFEEDLGIELRLEPASGKLFPASNRARDVRDGLVVEARARGVEFRFGASVVALEPLDPFDRGDDEPAARRARWRLRSASGQVIDASSVILATGGLSVPKTGSDGTGLMIARGLGHEIHEPYAALTPLVDQSAHFGELAGVSLDVSLEAPTGRRPRRTHGGFLFTHRGYSGPAVLDISHLAVRSSEPGIVRALPTEATFTQTPASTRPAVDNPAATTRRQSIYVQWTALDRPAWEQQLAPRRASALAVLRAQLPARLADALLRSAAVPAERSLAELRSDERRRLLETLTHYELPWTSHEGYRTAEVTGGGVALSQVDPRTMESRVCRGIFLCGEMLDAFGPIGGYNFQWAWATGRAAGLGARGMGIGASGIGIGSRGAGLGARAMASAAGSG